MSRKKLYMLIQTILCILLCLLISLTVIRIYLEGIRLRETGDYLTWIYTREKVVERFGSISPLFFGAIGFMIAGLVLGMKDGRLDQPVPDAEVMRDLYSRKVMTPTAQMTAERKKQKKLRIIGSVLAVVCAVPVFLYMTDTAHFEGSSPELVSQAFHNMLLHIVPWIAIAFGCLSVTETLREKSLDREVQMAKAAMKAQRQAERSALSHMDETDRDGAKSDSVQSGSQMISDGGDVPDHEIAGMAHGENHAVLNAVRIAVFAAAVILIIHGINNGSMQDVLVKATNICTECIGLG